MAQATDYSGNASKLVSLTLTVQGNMAPELTIVSPPAAAFIESGSRVTVTVRAEDDAGIATIFFQAKGAAAANAIANVPAGSTTYTATFTLDVPISATPGSTLELSASAVDSDGLASAIQNLALAIQDTALPTIVFANPISGTAVNAGAVVAITVTANDNGALHALTLEASGAATFSETRIVSPTAPISVTFQVPVAATAHFTESIILVATAEDGAGNRSLPATLVLAVRDGEPPQVSLLLPAGVPQILPGGSTAISVTASDNDGLAAVGLQTAGAVATSQSQALVPPRSSASVAFTVTVPLTVTPGTVLTLTATAADVTGNPGASQPITLTVAADLPPHVTLNAPDASFTLGTGATITVTATASDDVGVTQLFLQSTGVVSASSQVTITPPALQRTVVFTLEIPGSAPLGSSLVLTASAVDTGGQSGTSAPLTLTVTADRTLPAIQIVAPREWRCV